MADYFAEAMQAVDHALQNHEREARALYVKIRKGTLTQTTEVGRQFNDHDRKAATLRRALAVLQEIRK